RLRGKLNPVCDGLLTDIFVLPYDLDLSKQLVVGCFADASQSTADRTPFSCGCRVAAAKQVNSLFRSPSPPTARSLPLKIGTSACPAGSSASERYIRSSDLGRAANVRVWHGAAHPECPLFGRFRG